MSVKLLFLVFAASMGLFLYNRANASGQPKPGSNPGVTPSAAKDQAGGEGAAALLPDVSQPYSVSSQGAVTFHSDLGSGSAPDAFAAIPPTETPYASATNAYSVSSYAPPAPGRAPGGGGGYLATPPSLAPYVSGYGSLTPAGVKGAI